MDNALLQFGQRTIGTTIRDQRVTGVSLDYDANLEHKAKVAHE
jgi:hypothetical protein